MLEKMNDFFKNRLEGYDEHMLNEIEGAKEFYPYTAALLPMKHGANVLDLGCGTGIELEYYFALNDEASVVGIDLSPDMLAVLKRKFTDREIKLICGSYFDIPIESNCYDAAVSVESLHHFTAEDKLLLYQKLHTSLKPEGYFILTDYFAESEALELEYFKRLCTLKKEQGIAKDEFYHFDTPLTVEHEISVLKAAGFSKVEALRNWVATYSVKAFV